MTPLDAVRPPHREVALAIGPGTGLGVATVIPVDDVAWRVLAGEGGHVALGALRDEEVAVLQAVRRRHGFVSAEMLLSGPGLTRLFTAVAETHGRTVQPLDTAPATIVQRACTSADHTSVATS